MDRKETPVHKKILVNKKRHPNPQDKGTNTNDEQPHQEQSIASASNPSTETMHPISAAGSRDSSRSSSASGLRNHRRQQSRSQSRSRDVWARARPDKEAKQQQMMAAGSWRAAGPKPIITAAAVPVIVITPAAAPAPAPVPPKADNRVGGKVMSWEEAKRILDVQIGGLAADWASVMEDEEDIGNQPVVLAVSFPPTIHDFRYHHLLGGGPGLPHITKSIGSFSTSTGRRLMSTPD